MPRKTEEAAAFEAERRYPCGRVVSKPRKEDEQVGAGKQHKAAASKANDEAVLLMVMRDGGQRGGWLAMSVRLSPRLFCNMWVGGDGGMSRWAVNAIGDA